jgi:hypothetical protein
MNRKETGQTCIVRRFMLVLLTDYSGHEIEMRWVRLEASTGETRKLNDFEWGNLKDRGHFELLGADRNIILKWILNNNIGRARTGFGLSYQGQ